MNILILNPPAHGGRQYIREGRCMQTRSSWAALWMPLSLAYVAAVLRADGHRIKLLDCIADGVDLPRLLAECEAFAPDLVFLNTAFPSIAGDRATGAALKHHAPATPIAILGMFPTLLEDQSLAEIPAADFAIVGEPEWAARKLADALQARGPLAEVKGLVWRQADAIRVNAPQDLAANDLDTLPFPARDLLHNNAYRLPINGEVFTLLNIGRGCPHPCIFCAAPAYYGRHFRKRGVQGVGHEIQECVEKYGIRHFLFWGESFTADPRYGEALCDEILARHLRIVWSTTSRVDTLSPALLAKMKRAGCAMLGLGIESSDPQILARARKQVALAQITKAINLVHAAGIKTMGHFIFGLPGETRETAEATIHFALRSGLHYAQFYCAVPYPKTELGKLAGDHGGRQASDYAAYDLATSIMGNEALSRREIKALRDRAYRRFYLRPRMAWQVLAEIKSWRHFFAALDFFKWIRG